LKYKQRYYWHDKPRDSGVDGMGATRSGHFSGLRRRASNVVLSGRAFNMLHVIAGDKVYARKTKKGASVPAVCRANQTGAVRLIRDFSAWVRLSR
jgi:hypothetical protein